MGSVLKKPHQNRSLGEIGIASVFTDSTATGTEDLTVLISPPQ